MIFSPKQLDTLSWWSDADADMIDGIINNGNNKEEAAKYLVEQIKALLLHPKVKFF